MIDLVNLSLQFGGKYLFRNVNYKINSGDKLSLVGANGTGKSSFLKIISGQLQPESGTVAKQKRITIGYLPQEQITHKGKTLLEEAKTALTDIILLQVKEKEITEQLKNETLSDDEKMDLVLLLGEVHHRLEELDSYSAESRIEKILIGLGFEENDFIKLTNEFSGGWQMRIALAKILISQNDLLLLDEPTNHLDLDSLAWLIQFLRAYKGALLIVSHDKHFVNSVTTKTLEIYLNKFNTFNGNYDAFIKYKEERDIQTEALFEQQQKKIKEQEKFIERFRYKSSKAKQVQSRVKMLDKIELIELPDKVGSIDIRFPDPIKPGKVVLTLNNISKSYGNNKVFENLDFEILREDKIAFVGPNGAGKSTLSKIICDETKIDNGERIEGHNVSIAYYAQDVADSLNPELDILETIEEASENKTIGQLRSLLGSFLFSGDDVFKKVGVLSGGEKSRVALAKILLTKANLILLDEPTNHLDFNSKLVLQKALMNFQGALILVSHDIDFLRPIVNKVVEIRKGEVKIFPDEIDYYLEKKELFSEVESTNNIKIDSNHINRKDQKRIEAENRQKKYKAVKELKRKIEQLEKEIEKKEKEEKRIESLLADSNTYNDIKNYNKLLNDYKTVKESLEQFLSDWEVTAKNLTEIEKEFDVN